MKRTIKLITAAQEYKAKFATKVAELADSLELGNPFGAEDGELAPELFGDFVSPALALGELVVAFCSKGILNKR